MTTFSVRDAAVDDEPALAGIFRRASLANPGDREVLLAHPAALALAEDLISRGRTRVATSADGVVVGFASTRPTDPGALELDDLFVDPAVMRQGVGRRLIGRIVTEAAGEDVTRIDVTANDHALDFYRAVGFVPAGRAATEFGPARRMRLDVAGRGTAPGLGR